MSTGNTSNYKNNFPKLNWFPRIAAINLLWERENMTVATLCDLLNKNVYICFRGHNYKKKIK
jgi:hypothetical protein